MEFRTIVHVLCALLITALLPAVGTAAGSVKAAHAWARATAPGQSTAVVYLELTSDANAALVAAGTPLAQRVEIHSMTMDGGIMRMRPLPRIELPAGKTVRLGPAGAHLMLIDLKQPLKAGGKVPLVLSVEASGTSPVTLNIEAEVRGGGSNASHTH